MNEGWKTAKLGDVCLMIKRGIAPKYIETGGLRVVNQKCVRDHIINYDLARRHDLKNKSINQERYIQVGDVLVNSTGTGTLGRVAYVRESPLEPTTVDTHVTIVRPKGGKFFNDFFGYMLVKIEDEIASSGAGASGQTELARTTLESKFVIHYPNSFSEQKRIVALLDQAFEGIDKAIANTEKNLANARELFESYLNDIFTKKGEGWEEKRLSDLIDISHGFAFKGKDFNSGGKESLPIVLTPGNYGEDAKLYFTEKNTKRFSGNLPEDYLFDKNDLTVVMTDLSSKMKILGKPAFIDRPNILHNQRIGRVSFKVSWVLPRLVYYYLLTRKVSEKIKETSTGTMVRHTAPKRILSLNFSLPQTREEQAIIIHRLDTLLDETQSLEITYQQKLIDLSDLKQSILQKAFAGELTGDHREAAA